jgi:hypothetical protein
VPKPLYSIECNLNRASCAPPRSDYGFYRPTIDSHCIEFPDYNITQQAVCKDGRQKYYVSSGYAR